MTKRASLTPAPAPARSSYRIAHRTVSIPEWAHEELTTYQELIRDNGGIDAVPEAFREFAAEAMGPGNANFTKGLLFGLACKVAVAEANARLKLEKP